MNRNYSTEAVVLKTGRIGDYHKSVTILSPERGIIQAIAHGAYKGKSRLSSITDPFCISEFELYHNPVKDLWKINNCESRTLNSGIREDLGATCHASFWSELVLKSHASGADYSTVYSLFTSALGALAADNSRSVIVTVHFLYRFLLGSGFITDFSECCNCGNDSAGRTVFFSPSEGGFLCEDCASGGLAALKSSSAVYLQDSIGIQLEEAIKKRLDLYTEKEIRNVLLAVLRSILDTPLNTLDFIDGME